MRLGSFIGGIFLLFVIFPYSVFFLIAPGGWAIPLIIFLVSIVLIVNGCMTSKTEKLQEEKLELEVDNLKKGQAKKLKKE